MPLLQSRKQRWRRRDAFFVTGQEMGTANHRAFAALDGCLPDGSPCEVGVECCGQMCTNGKCMPPTSR